MSIPEYPTLYIFKNNKIYQWSIKIEKDGSSYKMITSHGQKDGAITDHEKVIDKGKASRTVLEQAILEADSKFKQKKEKELYAEKVNTHTKIDVRPMLANKFSFDLYKKGGRSFKISFPAYGQRKYDGIRCISYLDTNTGKVVLESRKGIEFQNFNALKDLLGDFFKKLPPNFYFDGELFTDEIDFEVISGLIRLHEEHTSKEDLKKIDKIKYYIYDFYDANNPDLTFEQRLEILNNLLKDYIVNDKKKNNSLIVLVPTYKIDKLEDVNVYFDKFIKEGNEGIMIRDKDGPYEPNKRSKYLQKYKGDMEEEEFKIIGFTDGEAEKESIIWIVELPNKKECKVVPMGTDEYRKTLYKEGDKHIGKLLTVIFQGYTAGGSLRFPIGKAIRDIY
jgi:ATP-dependent DNA ligase